MLKDLNNDRPITSIAEDRFSRSDFARKVAGLCASKTPESRVIGLYGKWGDGKSSLLNMVSTSLEPEVVQIKFNPWVFRDENEFLLEFFRLFANSLGGSLELKKEKIQNAISDYGETIGLLGVFPKTAPLVSLGKNFLKFFKRTKPLSSEEAKNRVIELLINSRVNVAVFIDDIDRLDSREVCAVFKLVKLLADFPRTTYLLSFDPEIVARMIAPQYGGTSIEYGYQYLEKVIQLPLNIPMAHSDAVLHFLNDAIQHICMENKLNLETETEKLAEYFVDGLMVLLDNPRKVIRFCNSLRFTIPILKEEANILDLIVMETFKITAPELYHFIRNEKYLMLEDYIDERPEYEAMREEAVKKISLAVRNYPEKHREAFRILTCSLFPNFAWQYPAEAKGLRKEQLQVSRRICVPEYFDRYFTFSLQSDEISDSHFTATYVVQDILTSSDIALSLENDIKKFSFEVVANKMANHRYSIKGEAAEKLLVSFCKVCSLFEEQKSDFASPFRMMVITAESLIKGLDKDRQFSATMVIAEHAATLNFAADVLARFIMPISREDNVIYFPIHLSHLLKEAYLKRLKKKIAELGFFNAVSESRMARQLAWWRDVDADGLRQQIDHVFLNINEAPIKFLRIFTPTIYSTDAKGEKKEIKANFQEEQFLLLDQVVGARKLLDHLKYGHFELLENYDWSRRPGLNEEIEDEELAQIFNFLHKLKVKSAAAIDNGHGSGLLRRDN